MKTKIILLAVLAGTVFFSACAGTRNLGAFDEALPEEMQCYLEIRNSLGVILFNNQPVDWSPGLTQSRVTISLPPGDHSFTVRYYESRSYGGGYSETVQITSNLSATEFRPGHSYRIYKQKIWLLFFTINNIKIKDVTPKERPPKE